MDIVPYLVWISSIKFFEGKKLESYLILVYEFSGNLVRERSISHHAQHEVAWQ